MKIILLLLSFLVITAAVNAEKPRDTNAEVKNQECSAASDGDDGRCADVSSTSVYAIGDLHGDVKCAVTWVNRTGLVANLINEDASSASLPLYQRLNDQSEWRWTEEKSTLVFMGDYVDKGPTSRQTVEFVKALTDAFPDRVTGILGNHELELLRDRDARIEPMNRYSSYSYATVHPGEYHNYFGGKEVSSGANDVNGVEDQSVMQQTALRSLDEKDDLVLDLLLEAGMEVYAARAHSAVRFVPSLPENTDPKEHGIHYAITDIIPPQHRDLARKRLVEYADAYLNAYRSETALGQWMEKRPIMHLAENIKTLFVHGGVSDRIGKAYLSNGKEDVDKLNTIWWEHANEGKLYDFLQGRGMSPDDATGYDVYDLLTYRGNHPEYQQWESHGTIDEDGDSDVVCKTLHDMLNHMEGIDRIAVGHTPGWGIRVMCNGAFLALDSTLGRWIRGSGNEYCPGPEHFEKRQGVDVPRTSRDGRYRCDVIKGECEGQIVRLDSDGSVNILTME